MGHGDRSPSGPLAARVVPRAPPEGSNRIKIIRISAAPTAWLMILVRTSASCPQVVHRRVYPRAVARSSEPRRGHIAFALDYVRERDNRASARGYGQNRGQWEVCQHH